jgi:hypothetical protein
MKKVFILCFALAMGTTAVFGQITKFSRFTDTEANAVMGRPFKSSPREFPSMYMGRENGSYIFLSETFDRFLPIAKLQLERVDDRMIMTRKQEVKPKIDNRVLKPIRGLQLKSGVYFVGSALNTSDKKNMVYALRVDPEKLAFGDAKTLASIDYSGGKRSESKEVKFSFAPDSSKFLVYYNIPGKKEDAESFGFNIYDNDLEVIYEMQVQIPYSEKLFDVMDVAIDNDGTVFLAGKLYQEKRRERKKGGGVNYSTKFLVFKKGSNMPEEINIEFDDIYLRSMKMSFRGNIISAVGFFAEEAYAGDKGVFVMDIDKNKAEMISHNLKYFDKKFFTLGLTAKEQAKVNKRLQKGKDVTFNEYVVDHLIPRADGSFTIIAEQRYIRVVQTSTGNGNSRTDYYYHNNHVIAFKVNKDNEIEWYSKVVKQQVTSNDGGFSNGYVLIPTQSKLFFLFNDGHKAYDPKKTKTPGFVSTYMKKKKSTVSLTTMNLEDGAVKKVKVMDGKTDKFLLIPRGTAVQDGTIITHFFNPKQRRYGSITVQGMQGY